MDYDRCIQAENGVLLFQGATPILMKTPSGACFIGFSGVEVAKHFLSRQSRSEAEHSFLAVSMFVADGRIDKKGMRIVFFATIDDVDRFAWNPPGFPFREFEVTLHEIDQKG